MTSPSPTTDRIANPKRILCPIDLSDFSQPALAYAVALGHAYSADVTVLHVFTAWLPPVGVTTLPNWMTEVPETRESLTNELHALLAPFGASGTPLHLRTAEGDAASEIVRSAGDLDVDLIVVGTHGRSGFDRFTLGSVAEKVIRKAPCPVLTLPPGVGRTLEQVTFGNILCPMDFSGCSERALDFAVALAARINGSVTAVHVVEALDQGEELHGPEYIVELRRRQCQAAQTALHDMVAAHAGTERVTEVIAIGRPHREILRVAGDRASDLIVIGVRGRGPIDITLFGSTTNQVVRRATCPVVTIRSPLQKDQ